MTEFNGAHDAFWRWEKQLQLLKNTYNLDDDSSRILLGIRLRGSALDWFHSKPEHLEMTLAQLLTEMRTMFDHRPTKLTLRRQFEGRQWKPSETFGEYFKEKLTFANRIDVPADELVDYIIEGIPDSLLQNQARIQNFTSKDALLKAFEKISLRRSYVDRKDHGGQSNRRDPVKQTAGQQSQMKQSSTESSGTSGEASKVPKSQVCNYCKKEGHLKYSCPKLPPEKRLCYLCRKTGHTAKECTSKEAAQVNNVDSSVSMDDEYFRTISFKMYCENGKEHEEKLITLLDTGSPVSFIKLSHVPSNAIDCPDDDDDNKFHGINSSDLVVLGVVDVDIEIDGKISEKNRLLVVPDDTMVTSVVLGRIQLRNCGLGLREVSPVESNYNAEIINIDITSDEDEADSLIVNSEIPFKIQKRLRELFRSEYLTAARPENPSVCGEINLTLSSEQPIYFQPRRLSHVEKLNYKE